MASKTTDKTTARQAIIEGMVSLMATSSSEDINVKELLTTAGVTRSAFYYHYDSINSVLTSMIETIAQGVTESTKGLLPESETPLALWGRSEAAYEASLALFAFVYENRQLYEALARDAYTSLKFSHRLREAFEAAYEECNYYFLDEKGRRCVLAPREREYYVDTIVSHNLGIIDCWCRRRFRETPEELANLSRTLNDLSATPLIERHRRYRDQGRVYLATWEDLAASGQA